MEVQAALHFHCASYQATPLHELRAHLGGEDELFSRGVKSPMQTCTYRNFHSHRKTLDISAAISEVPEPASVLQAVQALPVH